jgi:D-beta-D-heptose 7-phosphate kinase/D-beta-D-heptose 1-phosphate adenosyltransferase
MSAPALDFGSLRAIVSRFSGRRIAVLGDVMIDRYLWGHVDRISPEAPVPVVEVERESSSLGGAGNVAANLSALGAIPSLIACVATTTRAARSPRAGLARRARRRARRRGGPADHREDAHHRALATGRARRSRAARRHRGHAARTRAPGARNRAGAGRGARHQRLRQGRRASGDARGRARAGEATRHSGVRRSKESHIDAYRGVTVLTPNQHEAGYVQGRRVVDEASLAEVGWGLQQRLDAEAVLVTRGPGGMSLFEKGGRYTYLPTVAREV